MIKNDQNMNKNDQKMSKRFGNNILNEHENTSGFVRTLAANCVHGTGKNSALESM